MKVTLQISVGTTSPEISGEEKNGTKRGNKNEGFVGGHVTPPAHPPVTANQNYQGGEIRNGERTYWITATFECHASVMGS